MEREAGQAREMSQAAERFASAVEEFSRQVGRLGTARKEPLSEGEAVKLTDEAVHRVRREMAAEEDGMPRAPQPTLEEMEAWERRREERRGREGYSGYEAS